MKYESAMSVPVRLVANRLNRLKCKVCLPCFQSDIDLFTIDTGLSTIGHRFRIRTSRDYQTPAPGSDAVYPKPVVRGGQIRLSSWFTFSRAELQSPTVDYIVLLLGNNLAKPVFLVVKPVDLRNRLNNIYGVKDKYDVYMCVTAQGMVLDWRGLGTTRRPLVPGEITDTDRDYTTYKDLWPRC